MSVIAIPSLNLEAMPTKPGTLAKISAHISAHRAQMDFETLDYYALVRAMLQDQLRKPAARRASMQELSRRAYNLDAIIVQGGAASSQLICV